MAGFVFLWKNQNAINFAKKIKKKLKNLQNVSFLLFCDCDLKYNFLPFAQRRWAAKKIKKNFKKTLDTRPCVQYTGQVASWADAGGYFAEDNFCRQLSGQ